MSSGFASIAGRSLWAWHWGVDESDRSHGTALSGMEVMSECMIIIFGYPIKARLKPRCSKCRTTNLLIALLVIDSHCMRRPFPHFDIELPDTREGISDIRWIYRKSPMPINATCVNFPPHHPKHFSAGKADEVGQQSCFLRPHSYRTLPSRFRIGIACRAVSGGTGMSFSECLPGRGRRSNQRTVFYSAAMVGTRCSMLHVVVQADRPGLPPHVG